VRPSEVDPSEWLAFEQEKHVRLLAAAGAVNGVGVGVNANVNVKEMK
jgi:hypothetical protein